jgi:NAD(P)-dependent dehydrogenase (short-subunit alcohol dehydrogenase family)
MSGRLDGKVAVITGAGSGLGRATAGLFHREGAKVVLGDISGRQDEVAGELGDGALAVQVDVTSREQNEALIARAVEAFGGIDVLACCAGVDGELAAGAEISDESLRTVIEVNLWGPFHAMRAAVPRMIERGGGSIITIASATTDKAIPMLGAYATSKAALVRLTRGFGTEYIAQGIRSNVVSPGAIDTPLSRALPPAMFDASVEATPIGRPAEPEEIAQAILFLASDESSFVTAASFAVDGAMSVS